MEGVKVEEFVEKMVNGSIDEAEQDDRQTVDVEVRHLLRGLAHVLIKTP